MLQNTIYSAGNEEWTVELTGEWDENNLVVNGILTFTDKDGNSYKETTSGDILNIDTYVNNKIQLK